MLAESFHFYAVEVVCDCGYVYTRSPQRALKQFCLATSHSDPNSGQRYASGI